MRYQLGDELYLRTGNFEGPVRVTHVGSKFYSVNSTKTYYVEQIDEPIERAVEDDWLSPLTAVGAGAP